MICVAAQKKMSEDSKDLNFRVTTSENQCAHLSKTILVKYTPSSELSLSQHSTCMAVHKHQSNFQYVFFPNHIRETEDWETLHGSKFLFPSHPHAKSGKYSKWCTHLTPGTEWSTYHWQSHTLKYKPDPYLFSCLTLYQELINRNLKWRRRAQK